MCATSLPYILLAVVFFSSCARDGIDRRLGELKRLIEQKSHFEDSLQARVDSLFALQEDSITLENAEKEYRLSWEIYQTSNIYSFEYAERAVSRMVQSSILLGNSDEKALALILQAYNYARAGFFHEAQASFDRISLDSLGNDVLANYYILRGRAYHDLADYTHDNKYTPYYNKAGNEYLQKSLEYTSDSVKVNYIKGKIHLKSGRKHEALEFYHKALKLCPETDDAMKGVLCSSLAYIYRKLNEPEKATYYYIDACEICIRNVFRDVNSQRGLAEMLYNTYGNVDASISLINLAVENAQRYGTRSRINNIGALMPLYVSHKLKKDSRTKYILVTLVCSITILLVILLVILKRYHERNLQLDSLNVKLRETNLMKDTYLGVFIDTQSEFSHEICNFALVASQKIKMQQYDSLMKHVNQLERKYNTKEILTTFDRVFLTIYPTFIDEFNDLLLPENRMEPKSKGEIPPTMRIFALVRLGIMDNNRIAVALNYSYNTIHNYRVRARKLAINPQNFENDVMKIGL